MLWATLSLGRTSCWKSNPWQLETTYPPKEFFKQLRFSWMLKGKGGSQSRGVNSISLIIFQIILTHYYAGPMLRVGFHYPQLATTEAILLRYKRWRVKLISDRIQMVVQGSDVSNFKTIQTGVPQDSVLGRSYS